MKCYVSPYFIDGQRVISTLPKRAAAVVIAHYLNSINHCSWHAYSIAEVNECLFRCEIEEFESAGLPYIQINE